MTEEGRKELRARIMSAPDPMTTSPLVFDDPVKGRDLYSLGGDTIAKAMLLLAEGGATFKDAYDAYEKVEKMWPGFDEWFGGATGFMVGWAANVASQLAHKPPIPNPALITVKGGR